MLRYKIMLVPDSMTRLQPEGGLDWLGPPTNQAVKSLVPPLNSVRQFTATRTAVYLISHRHSASNMSAVSHEECLANCPTESSIDLSHKFKI